MIALTISDAMDAETAIIRLSELIKRNASIGVPDAVCIRNDTFAPEPFASMTELIGKLWNGRIILETDDPSSLAKAILPIIDRAPILVGANKDNLEQFSMIAKMFGCPLCISCDNIDRLYDLAQSALDSGVCEVIIDPMMRNMKQCLERCTDIARIKGEMPELDHKVAVRTWSGEYAMTMATVSLLVDDAIVIVDDLDGDCCDTLSALLSSIR